MADTVNVIDNLNEAQGDQAGTISVNAAGDLILTAFDGGANGEGAILEIAATPTGFADSANVLGSFPADSNGVSDSMTMDAQGNLFTVDSSGELWEIPATANGGYGALTPVLATGFTDPTKLTVDSNGDLFGIGTDADGNTDFFELANTANGYVPIELAPIPSNGGFPGNPTMDAQGNLFVAAGPVPSGGEPGEVLELSPQVGTATGYASSASAVATFDDGVSPNTKVVVGANGDLFGGASDSNGNEIVYEIAKSNGTYSPTPTVLATLTGDFPADGDGVLADANNDIFMVVNDANGNSDVVELVNTPNGYVANTLATFDQNSALGNNLGVLSFDAQGDLIGSTFDGGANGDGTVFEISNAQLYVAPTMTGVTASETTKSDAAIDPFSGVTITDPNDTGSNVDTLTITQTGTGTLSDGAGFTGLTQTSPGVYTLSGTSAAITSELDALTFTPAAGSSSSTSFDLSYQSSVYSTPVTGATTVENLDAPTISDAAVANGLVTASGDTASQALSGTALANSTVSIYLNGSSTPAYTTTADANGNWSQTIGALSAGSYSFTTTATDASGNVSAASSPLAFDVVTQGPSASIAQSVSGVTVQTSDTITVTPGALQTGDSVTGVAIYDGSTFVGDAIAGQNGQWTYTASNLALGDHDFSAVVSDAAGYSTQTATLPTVDVVASSPPSVSITSAGGFVTQQQTINVTASAAAGDSVTSVAIYDGSTLLGQAKQGANGTWSANVTLPVGADAITAVATDAAGDTATSKPVDYLAAPTGDTLITAKAWSIVAFANNPTAVNATAGDVAVIGGNGNDLVFAGADDIIALGNGNDTVNAGANSSIALGTGTDTLVAAAGDSWLLSSAGHDTFEFGASSGDNAIVGFNVKNDVLDFSDALFSNFSQVQSDMKQVGANTEITYGANDVVTLDNVKAATLTASDFKFVA